METNDDAITSWDFIKQNYRVDDRVALVIRNRNKGYILQRLVPASDAASPRMQRFLRYENAHGSDTYISMNTLKPNAKGRTKADIAEIRHLYLDLDENGDARLQTILESPALPKPNYVLDTSPGKHQVIWRVEGFTLDQAEAALHSMAATFGGDPAATDATRVLRLPGFHNKKHPSPVRVEAHRLSYTICAPDDFSRTPRLARQHDSHSLGYSNAAFPYGSGGRNTGTSQSERDWAMVREQLRDGSDPERVRRELANSRQDKPNPGYYASRTVERALSR